MTAIPIPFRAIQFTGAFRAVNPILIGLSDCSNMLVSIGEIKITPSVRTPKEAPGTTVNYDKSNPAALWNSQEVIAKFRDDNGGYILNAILAYQNELINGEEVEFVVSYLNGDTDFVVREIRLFLTDINVRLSKLNYGDHTGVNEIEVAMIFDRLEHHHFSVDK